MGDADEAIASPKGTGDDLATPSVSSRPDLDMINLSSQLTGMELMSCQTRRGKKRVRFCLPEADNAANCDKNGEYRRREVGEYLRVKRRTSIAKVSHQLLQNSDFEELVEQDTVPKVPTETKGAYMFEIHEDNIILVKRRKQDSYSNTNTNCANKGKTTNKKKDINKRPSKSNECLTQKSVKDVSGGSKDDSCDVKYMLGDKRKVADILTDFNTMESKVKQSKPSQKGNKVKINTSSKSLCPENKKKFSKKSKAKGQRKSLVKIKAKLTVNKLKKSKHTKGKKLIKKASLRCKEAIKRKQKLKQKLAQKRKLLKKKLAKKKKMRKIKIIPIEREEEVSECLRINLLKFLTFENAYDYKFECCRQLCWDRWKELDIDDVIADFD